MSCCKATLLCLRPPSLPRSLFLCKRDGLVLLFLGGRPPEMGHGGLAWTAVRVAKKTTPKRFDELSEAWTTCLALFVVHHDVISRLTAAVSLQRSFKLLPLRLCEVARHQSFTASLLLELLDNFSDPSTLLLRQGTLETG